MRAALTKDNANDELMRLVKHLYGEKTYPVPQTKGTKPDWVSQSMVMPPVAAGPLLAMECCREKIKSSAGVIAIITDTTRIAPG